MSSITCAKVHIPTLLGIVEQYQRRSENYPIRLIGAILGSVVAGSGQGGDAEEGSAGSNGSGASYFVDIRHSFPVLHSEVGDQISINSEYYRARMELHRKASGRESVLLGWYSAVLSRDAKPVDPATFAKNGEFIREYFVREANTKGAPFALHLNIAANATGQITLEVVKYPTGGSSATTAESSALPVQIAYGVPEAFAVDLCRETLLAEDPVHSRDGKLLAPLSNWQAYRHNSRELIHSQATLLAEHSGEAAGEQAARQILSKLGLTEATNEDRQDLARNQEEFCRAIDELNKQLSRSDRLLLTQNFLVSPHSS